MLRGGLKPQLGPGGPPRAGSDCSADTVIVRNTVIGAGGGHVLVAAEGEDRGYAASREQAMASFKAAWERKPDAR